MNNNKEFKLYKYANDLYHYVDNTILNNIPNIKKNVKIHLQDEVYMLNRLIMSASYSKGNIRNKNINDMLVCISMIDFLLGEIMDISKESNKKAMIAIRLLTNIKNIVYAWKSNIEKDVKEEN